MKRQSTTIHGLRLTREWAHTGNPDPAYNTLELVAEGGVECLRSEGYLDYYGQGLLIPIQWIGPLDIVLSVHEDGSWDTLWLEALYAHEGEAMAAAEVYAQAFKHHRRAAIPVVPSTYHLFLAREAEALKSLSEIRKKEEGHE